MIAIKNYHPNGFLVPSMNADSFTLLVWFIKTSRLVMFVWKEILICPEHQLSLVRFVGFCCLVAFHHVWFWNLLTLSNVFVSSVSLSWWLLFWRNCTRCSKYENNIAFNLLGPISRFQVMKITYESWQQRRTHSDG